MAGAVFVQRESVVLAVQREPSLADSVGKASNGSTEVRVIPQVGGQILKSQRYLANRAGPISNVMDYRFAG